MSVIAAACCLLIEISSLFNNENLTEDGQCPAPEGEKDSPFIYAESYSFIDENR